MGYIPPALLHAFSDEMYQIMRLFDAPHTLFDDLCRGGDAKSTRLLDPLGSLHDMNVREVFDSGPPREWELKIKSWGGPGPVRISRVYG